MPDQIVSTSIPRLLKAKRAGASMKWRGIVIAGIASIVGLAPSTAFGGDGAVEFEPHPISKPLYGTQGPEENPEQRRYVTASDGVRIYVESFRPAPKDGRKPPGRVPTILIMTPYEDAVFGGALGARDHNRELASEWTSYGYAVSLADVRGTAKSGGCFEFGSRREVDDTARVIDYLAKDAPWSNGTVGMYGESHEGFMAEGAASVGDRRLTSRLKAIAVQAPISNWYEVYGEDGVLPLQAPVQVSLAPMAVSLPYAEAPDPDHTEARPRCVEENFRGLTHRSGDLSPWWSGDFSPWWAERDYKAGARNVRAAVLIARGVADTNALPFSEPGFFDRLPKDTPRKAIVGQWAHQRAEDNGRPDWRAAVHAWFDRYLMGLDTRPEDWPTAQVQGGDGGWRVADDWPWVGGPAGQLALGPASSPLEQAALGTSSPAGRTAYPELSQAGPHRAPSRGAAVFETKPLGAPLHISGQPVVDLWVELEQPDAHVTAMLEALGPDGVVRQHPPVYGFRSARHLAPFEDGRFTQSSGTAPDISKAIRVPIRFNPTDFTVPGGGRLRLTVAGSYAWDYGDLTVPSDSTGIVRILHDCRHPSTLHFTIPSGAPIRLGAGGGSAVSSTAVEDGDGLAGRTVCGRPPIDPKTLVYGSAGRK